MLLDHREKYAWAQNIPQMVVPKNNDAIWEAMKQGPQVTDVSIQKVQTVLVAFQKHF